MDSKEEKYNISEALGLRIRYLRGLNQITQKELSDRLDMDDGSLRRIESGRTNPTLETINKIAHALDIPLWLLFVPDDELNSHSIVKDMILKQESLKSSDRML